MYALKLANFIKYNKFFLDWKHKKHIFLIIKLFSIYKSFELFDNAFALNSFYFFAKWIILEGLITLLHNGISNLNLKNIFIMNL